MNLLVSLLMVIIAVVAMGFLGVAIGFFLRGGVWITRLSALLSNTVQDDDRYTLHIVATVRNKTEIPCTVAISKAVLCNSDNSVEHEFSVYEPQWQTLNPGESAVLRAQAMHTTDQMPVNNTTTAHVTCSVASGEETISVSKRVKYEVDEQACGIRQN